MGGGSIVILLVTLVNLDLLFYAPVLRDVFVLNAESNQQYVGCYNIHRLYLRKSVERLLRVTYKADDS